MATSAARLRTGEEHGLVRQVPVGQEAEGRAAVAHVAEAQQAVDERHVVVQLQRADDASPS